MADETLFSLEIDGKAVSVPKGTTIMRAAEKIGVYIPHFCYHPQLTVAANCRMCMVEVEKMPRPMPACATPVANDMKVYTRSELAKSTQQMVMTFLLANHPLDCPVCDQGGECPLQDQALGFGPSHSFREEPRRAVPNKDIGPLIATEMTRCIHCTRCVRFGEQLGGQRELGLTFRGEHAEITSFLETTVGSEVSGNMIDICPVGALTSKPFRFKARSWELVNHFGIAPHDSLGSHLIIQEKRGILKRVLPRENTDINDIWLSDRDRFSYEGVQVEDRLLTPMIREGENLKAVDWQTAIAFVSERLRTTQREQGGDAIGILASPASTLEELFALKKIAQQLECPNIDTRLRQMDFSLDEVSEGVPWLGMRLTELLSQQTLFIAGSNLRKDHPLLALRIRQAAREKGLNLLLAHYADEDPLIPVAEKIIAKPSTMAEKLAGLCYTVAKLTEKNTASHLANIIQNTNMDFGNMAKLLVNAKSKAILVGNSVLQAKDAGLLYVLLEELARLSDAHFGVLREAANSVGAHLVGAVPHAFTPHGKNAKAMLDTPRKAYLLYNFEPEFDLMDGTLAEKALASASFVAAFSPYQSQNPHIDCLLPIPTFGENEGTFINAEGKDQCFKAAIKPAGEARQGWKVLKVLAENLGLHLPSSLEEIKSAAFSSFSFGLNNLTREKPWALSKNEAQIERFGYIPIYAGDAIVRRAKSLQKTPDAQTPKARLHPETAQRLGIHHGALLRLQQSGEVTLEAELDIAVPLDTVCIAGAHPATLALGPLFGPIEVSSL